MTTPRLRDPRTGRFLPDPKTLDDTLNAPDFGVGLLRYMERWVRTQRQAQRRARERTAGFIPGRPYRWLPGGRFRLQAWATHRPRDGHGRFVGIERHTHGTTSSYTHGCRCPDCTAAWRERMTPYMRRYTKARG